MLASNRIDSAVRYSGWASNIYISCTQISHEVVLSVRDDGQGVAASEVNKLFERFFRRT
ncbi:Histidine kinase-, DNA gyrase B-, and HSP90-like ATPase [Dyella jiangningensis]|uniref:ATP-binding protein n=1 Tax=Dyella sp. AtDHG13 TaxID=1938897 RepID=UPI000889703F|nr:sensor histidine kinase [Dyella sp. AtDHG13]PXV58958.1 histidine kinase/DNA gyrase B/HSP90-like ATPase [Dyella sp. AtDHG13]SDL31916.1 Histidine kinase-, DNA gyrase B-, and HSP90-like ATPase [Dyella jiangningensis]